MEEPVIRPLGDLMFRLPREYLRVGLGTSGFALWLRADDFGPFKPRPSREMGRHGIDLTVSISRFEAGLGIRRGIYAALYAVPSHPPAIEEVVVHDLGFGPVPAGLRFFRALPAPGPASGEREDMFVPTDALEGPGLYDIREAIFCKSPESRNIRDGNYPAGRRPCTWSLAHRGLELELSLDRRHLARWQEVRAGVLGRLDSFILGPAR